MLVMLVTQLGSVPMPRINTTAPVIQTEVQKQTMTTTTPLATGAADWAAIEGVRSYADVQQIAAPAAAPIVKREIPGMPLWGTTHMPARLQISSVQIDAEIAFTPIVNGSYGTQKGLVNWLENAELGRGNTLVFWAFDFGFRDNADMPFSAISQLTPGNSIPLGAVMKVTDSQGNSWGYQYGGMITTDRRDTVWMTQTDRNMVILIASAGELIRDPATGRVIDSTHRAIYYFDRMPLFERAQTGLR
jgi:hypothetical protein